MLAKEPRRLRKYAKFAVFYAKIVQMTPLRLRRESFRLQKYSVENKVFSLPFSQQIQFLLIANMLILIKSSKLKNYTAQQNRKRVNYN